MTDGGPADFSSALRFLAQHTLAANTPPEVSGELWRAFVEGAYELVDRFDEAGRCYVVALRSRGRRRALRERERVVLERRAQGELLESIAADLGVSVSAVSRRLHGGMKKLGIVSQAELLRLWGTR